jgi:hypothetical protein
MKTLSKKCTALAVAAALFTASSTVAPKRSEAALGLLVGTLGGNPVASVMFFVGAVGSGVGAVHFFKKGWKSSGGEAFVNYLIAAACAVGAYVMLDSSDARSGELKSMNAEDAKKLGLTDAEWRSYEADLPLVNALREETIARTNADLKNLEVKTAADLEKIVTQLRTHWQSLSEGAIAPETQSVIQKLGRAAVAQ